MRANPGGMIAPAEVVGRDRLIAELWRVLEQRSLVLDAERRIGKTCMIRKMTAEPPPGVVAVYRDLEGMRTPQEFAESVVRDGLNHLGRIGRTAWKLKRWAGKLGGAELKGKFKLPEDLGPHWKALLEEFCSALCEGREERVLFFWDEVPLMLQNFMRRDGGAEAMELLDLLRSLRQTTPNLRMVFTGSIGIANLIDRLHETGHPGDPTNDMAQVDVPPLAHVHAVRLAHALFLGEGLLPEGSPPDAACELLAAETDGVPYYIHHLVDRLAIEKERPTTARIRALIERALRDPADPWHLAHFRERLLPSYGPARGPLARRVLDLLAFEDDLCGFARLANLLAGTGAPVPADDLRPMLRALTRDHYLIREEGWRFRFPLVQRWWRRRLEGLESPRPAATREDGA